MANFRLWYSLNPHKTAGHPHRSEVAVLSFGRWWWSSLPLGLA